MAINFLNTVDFNKNQLNFAVIQNLGADPGTGVVGQIIFNTTDDTLKQYVADKEGSGNPGWVEVGSTSAVESLIAGTGIGISSAIGNVTVRNIGLVTVLDGTYIDLTKGGGGDNTQLTADLSAIDGTSDSTTRFLSKDNTWDIVSNISKATSTALGTVKLFSDTDQSVAATAVSAVTARTYGVQFNSSDQMVVNVPWTDTNVVTYTLTVPASTTNIKLTGSDGNDTDVTLSGTTGQTGVDRITGVGVNELRVKLLDDVTIANNLSLTNGVFTQIAGGQNKFEGQVTIPTTPVASTDAASKAYVDLVAAGVGVYQGAYNASTESPVLTGVNHDGLTQLAYEVGDYFVVSVAGSAFFSVELEPGDFIFVDVAITAGSVPTLANYTYIIADANIAGLSANAATVDRGVAGFDSAYFSADVGWISLKPQSNPYSRAVLLDGATLSYVTRASAGGETTFTIVITDAALFGTGALATNCSVEVVATSGRQTVYADVTGNGTGSIDIKFVPDVTDATYTALISYI